jgi:hypothetical protein
MEVADSAHALKELLARMRGNSLGRAYAEIGLEVNAPKAKKALCRNFRTLTVALD